MLALTLKQILNVIVIVIEIVTGNFVMLILVLMLKFEQLIHMNKYH